jgi:hypothetical protein
MLLSLSLFFSQALLVLALASASKGGTAAQEQIGHLHGACLIEALQCSRRWGEKDEGIFFAG